MPHYETLSPDYSSVPAGFLTVVCRCRTVEGYTSPVNWPLADPRRALYTLAFDWWVCSTCLKPSPMNALNARLIRECEMCEDPYLIWQWPDRMNCCKGCA